MEFSESLKKNDDFRRVYRKGYSKANSVMVLYVYKNHTEKNRLGISVSKKVGNSIVRHHMTRLIREVYRLHEDEFNIGLDLVVVVRNGDKRTKYSEVEPYFLELASLQRIMK
jgi:ribonuclease P protein component